jgi:hypothetical protein
MVRINEAGTSVITNHLDVRRNWLNLGAATRYVFRYYFVFAPILCQPSSLEV